MKSCTPLLGSAVKMLTSTGHILFIDGRNLLKNTKKCPVLQEAVLKITDIDVIESLSQPMYLRLLWQ